MIRCIAVDDEPLALQQMVRYLQRIPGVELIDTFYSVQKAKEVLATLEVDVLLLDIEMPDCNGVDFARALGDKCPYVIFTTAYPQYAVVGFRLDAVDYLLKPLAFEELETAFEKVKRRMSAIAEADKPAIYVKSSGAVHKIVISDILYIKGLGEYVQIFMHGNRNAVTTFDSIKRFENLLPADSFMRVHKSYLVNLRRIASATRTMIDIEGESIPVGEKYRADFAQYLKSNVGTAL